LPFRRKGKTEGEEQPEEEPAKGIKGKLKRIVSKFKRKKSSEGQSGSGIGGKLKGILRENQKINPNKKKIGMWYYFNQNNIFLHQCFL